MQLFRRAPLFFGWLAFYVITHVVTLLIVLPFRERDFQDSSILILFILIFLAVYILVGFLSFTFSIKNVVVPLYQGKKIASVESRRVKISVYLPRWLAYLFYLMLFCFPLTCGISGSLLVEDVIPYVWQLVASYFAYRLVVNELMEEIVVNNQKEVVTT